MPPRKRPEVGETRKIRPATTPEAREQQIISLAVNEAERQIANHEAPAAVLVHYLRLGTVAEQLQNEKLRAEIELKKKQIEQLQTTINQESLLADALTAFGKYAGNHQDTDYSDGR